VRPPNIAFQQDAIDYNQKQVWANACIYTAFPSVVFVAATGVVLSDIPTVSAELSRTSCYMSNALTPAGLFVGPIIILIT
jgi:hypothetical protein